MDKKSEEVIPASVLPLKKLAWLPAVATIVITILPILFLYAQNSRTIPLVDFLIVTAVASLIGIAIYGISFLILRERFCAGVLAICAAFLSMNFNLVIKLLSWIPFISSMWVGASLCFLALALLAVFLHKKREAEAPQIIVTLVSIGLCAIFLTNVFIAVPGTIKRLAAKSGSTGTKQNEAATGEGSNFYYIVTDEFFCSEMMEKYYGVDTTYFDTELRELGFDVSDFSSNLTWNTTINMANIFALDYVCSNDTNAEDALMQITDTSKMFTEFETMGYAQYAYSSRAGLFSYTDRFDANMISGAIGKKLFTSTDENDESFLQIVFSNTLAGQIWERIKPEDAVIVNATYAEGMFAFFDYLEGNSFPRKSIVPTANYIYICSPHVSFFCDSEGNVLPDDQKYNWTDRSIYVEQHAYVIKRLKNIIANILDDDPEAIIVLQSDHGVHTHIDTDLGICGPTIESADGKRILNAVYFKGETIDIEGLSGINTLRTVLTRMGRDFPLVEDVSPVAATPDD